MSNRDALECFRRHLTEQWLPTYCRDPHRKYAVEGYCHDYSRLAAVDASDFIYALTEGIVNDIGGGRCRAPRSKANEVIFWEGSKAAIARPITLWLEPIITIATVGRLHRDYGWPVELLGLQSADWAMDLVGYQDVTSDRIAVAGEVKKSGLELAQMIAYLRQFADDPASITASKNARAVNAARKWLSIAATRPPLFWAIGPGGGSELFAVTYDLQGPRRFDTVPLSRLAFST